MTPEGRVKRKVRAILDSHGAYYYAPVSFGYPTSGAPDLLACVYGFFVGIECKAGANSPTPLQLAALAKIRSAGGISLVIWERNLDELCRTLDSLKRT